MHNKLVFYSNQSNYGVLSLCSYNVFTILYIVTQNAMAVDDFRKTPLKI